MGLRRGRVLLAAAALAGVSVCLTACNEILDTSAGCPQACSGASPQVITETLNAVSSDATVLGVPGLGTESEMLLAALGDTLDSRVIVRFDTIPAQVQTQAGSLTTGPITFVDSALLHLRFDTAAAKLGVAVTISVYDVDTTATNDTAVATLAPLFSPAHFLASKTFAAGALHDTASIQLPSAVVLAKAQAGQALRVGIRIMSTGSVSVPILATETLFGPRLTMRIAADTAIPAITVFPSSRTPSDSRLIAGNLSDFTLVVVGTPTPPNTILAVGGLPASRVYLRFDIPPRIVDSSIVVRATLVLTQLPSASPGGADTMRVQPTLGVAGVAVTDSVRAAQIISNRLTAFEPLVTFPQQSGVKEIEIAPALSVWAARPDTVLPRTIVLLSTHEQVSPQQALFYSSEALDPAVRPQLRISYTLRSRIGTP